MKHGFSLVELSIVLVILGLLTGGILAGQNLIRGAELRSITTQYQSHIAAMNTFRDRYFALPGDMRNATDFWGTSPNCPGNQSQGNTDSLTCNGDGNGFVYYYSGSNEPYRFWQHLANAGLVEGNYNGVQATSAGTSHSTPGLNMPKGRLGNSGWDVYHLGTQSSTAYFSYDYGTVLFFGGTTANTITYGQIITPEEAWNIDTKVDDGLGGSGGLIAMWQQNCTDASGPTDYDAGYDLDNTAVRCGLIFKDFY